MMPGQFKTLLELLTDPTMSLLSLILLAVVLCGDRYWKNGEIGDSGIVSILINSGGIVTGIWGISNAILQVSSNNPRYDLSFFASIGAFVFIYGGISKYLESRENHQQESVWSTY